MLCVIIVVAVVVVIFVVVVVSVAASLVISSLFLLYSCCIWFYCWLAIFVALQKFKLCFDSNQSHDLILCEQRTHTNNLFAFFFRCQIDWIQIGNICTIFFRIFIYWISRCASEIESSNILLACQWFTYSYVTCSLQIFLSHFFLCQSMDNKQPKIHCITNENTKINWKHDIRFDLYAYWLYTQPNYLSNVVFFTLLFVDLLMILNSFWLHVSKQTKTAFGLSLRSAKHRYICMKKKYVGEFVCARAPPTMLETVINIYVSNIVRRAMDFM